MQKLEKLWKVAEGRSLRWVDLIAAVVGKPDRRAPRNSPGFEWPLMRQVFTARNLTLIVIIGACLRCGSRLVSSASGISLNLTVPIAAGTTGLVAAS